MKKQWFALTLTVATATTALLVLFGLMGNVGSGIPGPALAAPAERGDTAAPLSPTVTGVDPTVAPNDLDTSIVITGTGFTAVPTVTLGSTLLDDVGWVSAERLTATVPWGLITGTYTISVINPGGESGSVADAFTVTQGIGVWTTDGPYGGDVLQVILNPVTPTTAYAVMFGVGVFASVDEGATWEPIMPADNPTRIAFDAQDPDVIYAGGSGLQGDSLRSMDGGLNWEVFFDEFYPQNGSYLSCPAPHPTSGGEIYLGTGSPDGIQVLPGEGGIYYSDDYGGTWVTRTVGLTDTDIVDIAFHPANPDTMAVATWSGNVFTSTDAGLTWNWAADLNTDLRRLDFDPAGDQAAWLVPHREHNFGMPAELLRSTDPGLSNWVTVVVTSNLRASDGIWSLTFDSGDIWAAGDDGYKSTDGGATWSPIVIENEHFRFHPEVRSFAIAPGGGTVFAAEMNLSMFKSEDGGVTWIESYDGLAGLGLRDIAVSRQAPDTVYALTYERGLLKSDRGGRAWRWLDKYRRGPPKGALLATDPFVQDRLYLGDSCERFPCPHISDDGGEHWLEVIMTLPYAGPDWQGEIISVGPNPHVPGRVLAGGAFWEEQGDYDQGIEPCGFYASDDYGLDWTFMGPTPPISEVVSFAFDASDANLVYAGTKGMGLYRSNDGGGNWQHVPFPGILPPVDIESVAAHPDTPDKVYVRLYTYADSPNPQPNLFVSTDAGETWEELPDVDKVFGGIGGIDLAFLPPDAGSDAYQLYSGCEVGLCRRWEGTNDWEQAEGAPRPDILAAATDGERVMLYIGTRGGLVTGIGGAGTTGEVIPGWGSVMGGGVYRMTMAPLGSYKVFLPLVMRGS
jgi:photosystem II stability/assembly factor-like uncharacterized protein